MAKEKRTISGVIGETLIDLGKLIFGGIVLAGIFNSGFDMVALVAIGFAISLGAMALGVYYLTKKKED